MDAVKKGMDLSCATETSLVVLSVSGDNSAFEDLMKRRQGAIRGLMRKLTGDASLADDLAQDTFFLAWRKIRSLKKPGAFGGWLRQIAINTFLQYIRRNKQDKDRSVHSSSDKTVERVDPSVQVDLDKALERLVPVERLCVVLSYANG